MGYSVSVVVVRVKFRSTNLDQVIGVDRSKAGSQIVARRCGESSSRLFTRIPVLPIRCAAIREPVSQGTELLPLVMSLKTQVDAEPVEELQFPVCARGQAIKM